VTPRRVAIAGVAESDLGETGKSVLELQAQAVARALADAGVDRSEVDGLATCGVGRFPVIEVAEYLGLRPRWVDSTMVGGASFELFVGHAVAAIRSGQADVVLVTYGSNQRSARSRRLGGPEEPFLPSGQFEAPYGPLFPISLYAMAAERHHHEFGTTREQLAEVAVAARAWALRNPVAWRYRAGPLSVADVLGAPMVSSPLGVLDCCLVTDGGGAVVLTSLERARSCRQPVVEVLGSGECVTNASMAAIPDLTWTGAAESARRALGEAGVGLDAVDVVELYDSFTITVLLTLEAIGFCARGEGGEFVSGGRIAPGGELALNTSGGGLSYCHPGMFGIFLVIEAVRQLRGGLGDRQVEGAEVALCHGTGGILSSHGTVVLGRTR